MKPHPLSRIPDEALVAVTRWLEEERAAAERQILGMASSAPLEQLRMAAATHRTLDELLAKIRLEEEHRAREQR
uniref:Uncharacterized protein n=1 Tax=Hot spring virus BHS2 TaxID=2024352 RepID=A0A2U7P3E2_9VIRU|nr:hypothetical protein [Hot spring virus BHS2]